MQLHYNVILYSMTNKPEQITADIVMNSFINVYCLKEKKIKPNGVNYRGE